ncbi:MAG: substrate-binding domain-containing protein [Planctomycetes bacterium]|nr:substrate-binding domain-containing protein [Planctomycetota bacterium]
MKNALIAGLALLTTVFAALALRRGQHPSAPNAPMADLSRAGQVAAHRLHIGYVSMDMNNPYWRRVETGMKEVSNRFGSRLSIRDPQLDSVRQIREVEDLLQGGIDALLLSPINDETCTKALSLCELKRVPVVIVDVGAGQGRYACLTISDNRLGGYLAGKHIRDKMTPPGPIRVAWLQIPQAVYAGRLRSEGFAQAVQEFGFEIVGKQEASHRKDIAVRVMEDLLVRSPDLQAVFCENDEMALGALQAIRASQKLGQVLVVGFDGNPDALEAIRKGQLSATVAQDPELMGRMAVVNAYSVLADTLAPDARKDIYVPIRLITAESLQEKASKPAPSPGVSP